MIWIFGGAIAALCCYVMGYIIGVKVSQEKLRANRDEMELDEDCYGCKEIGLPCDPNCKFRKETLKDEQFKKNDSEKN